MSAVKTTLETMEREIAALPESEQNEVRRQVLMGIVDRLNPIAMKYVSERMRLYCKVDLTEETKRQVLANLLELVGIQIVLETKHDQENRLHFIRGRIIPAS